MHPWVNIYLLMAMALRHGVEGVGHLDGDQHGERHGHGLRRLEDLAGDALELLGGAVALHVAGQLPEGHLGAGGVDQEPVGGGSNGGGADIASNDHVSKEQPGGDKGLVSASGHLVHDVQVRGVEGEGGGGQTVSHQVDPQQLHGDQSLGEAEGGGQEDADHLTDVGGDQVADELLHVGVDGAALLHGGHDGGEVVVSQDHLGGGLGHGSSGAHGDTDLGSLESGSIVDSVSGHGGDF